MNNLTTVAATILDQLGDNRFLAMTGARNLVGGADDLRFHLPRVKTKWGVADRFWIKLEADDTYTLEAGRYDHKAMEVKRVCRAETIYVENLQATFTTMTGLRTRL
jgi:hypothetical protein